MAQAQGLRRRPAVPFTGNFARDNAAGWRPMVGFKDSKTGKTTLVMGRAVGTTAKRGWKVGGL